MSRDEMYRNGRKLTTIEWRALKDYVNGLQFVPRTHDLEHIQLGRDIHVGAMHFPAGQYDRPD